MKKRNRYATTVWPASAGTYKTRYYKFEAGQSFTKSEFLQDCKRQEMPDFQTLALLKQGCKDGKLYLNEETEKYKVLESAVYKL